MKNYIYIILLLQVILGDTNIQNKCKHQLIGFLNTNQIGSPNSCKHQLVVLQTTIYEDTYPPMSTNSYQQEPTCIVGHPPKLPGINLWKTPIFRPSPILPPKYRFVVVYLNHNPLCVFCSISFVLCKLLRKLCFKFPTLYAQSFLVSL